MKKLIIAGLAAVMVMSLSACSFSSSAIEEAADKAVEQEMDELKKDIDKKFSDTDKELEELKKEIEELKEEMPEQPTISKDEAISIAKQELSKPDATATVTREDDDYYYINLESKIKSGGEIIEDGVSCKVHKRTKKVIPLAG